MLTTRKKTILAAAMLGLWAAGCDENHIQTPTVIEPAANLQVSFDPNPGRNIGPGRYKYTVILTETAGTGVHIYGYEREVFSDAGTLDETFDGDQVLIESWFNDCGGEGNYVPPLGVRCTEFLSTALEEVKNAGYMIWTFYGVDDSGNEIISQGRLELE